MTDNYVIMTAQPPIQNAELPASPPKASHFGGHTAPGSRLRSSLLAALAFFDIFDYPLTLAEIRRFAYFSVGGRAPSLGECLESLAGLPVGRKDGYWFLRGREATVEKRHERYRLADRKFRKARWLTAWIRRLPWIRLVAVCNSLAWSNAGPDSDIDLFIVCRPGAVWLTRFFTVGWLIVFGLRPAGAVGGRDRFCLSFFLSEKDLDLARFALPGGDPYLAYWLAGIVPIYDAGGMTERLWAANEWIRRLLPGSGPHRYGRRRAVGTEPKAGSRKSKENDRNLSALSFHLSAFVERLQRRRFPPEIRAAMNRDTRVVVSDDVLKFHVNDRREEFRRRWREKLAAFEVVL